MRAGNYFKTDQGEETGSGFHVQAYDFRKEYYIATALGWLTFSAGAILYEFIGTPAVSWTQVVYGMCAAIFWLSLGTQVIYRRRYHSKVDLKSVDAVVVSITTISAIAYTLMACRTSWMESKLGGAKAEGPRVAQWASCVILHGTLMQPPLDGSERITPWLPLSLFISVMLGVATLVVRNPLTAWICLILSSAFFLHLPLYLIEQLRAYRVLALSGRAEFAHTKQLALLLLVTFGWCLYVIIFFITTQVDLSCEATTIFYSIVDLLSKLIFTWFHNHSTLMARSPKNLTLVAQARERYMREYWSKFMQYICHEVRNPLNAASLALELVHEEHPEVEVAIQPAYDGVQMAVDLLDNALLMQRMDANVMPKVMKSFDAFKSLGQLVRMYRPMAKAQSVELHLSGSEEQSPQLCGDSNAFCVILRNLIANAISVSTPGTNVFVNYSVIDSQASEITLMVKVQDQGPGLPPDYKERLFKPFSQLMGGRVGSGLGLFISHSLATDVLRGSLTAENGDIGCIFTLQASFSLDQQDAQDAASHRSDVIDPRTAKKIRVLIVDDVAMNRMCLTKSLSMLGLVKIYTATDGCEALAMLKDPVGNNIESLPDLVILDDFMPRMSGRELIRELRALPEFDRLMVIGCTGNALVSDQQDFLSAGLNALFTKPLKHSDIVECLRYLKPTLKRYNSISGSGYPSTSELLSEQGETAQKLPNWSNRISPKRIGSQPNSPFRPLTTASVFEASAVAPPVPPLPPILPSKLSDNSVGEGDAATQLLAPGSSPSHSQGTAAVTSPYVPVQEEKPRLSSVSSRGLVGDFNKGFGSTFQEININDLPKVSMT